MASGFYLKSQGIDQNSYREEEKTLELWLQLDKRS